MPPFFFPRSWIIFTIITLNSFSGSCLSPLHLVVLLYLVLSSGTYFSAVSLCLTFCVCGLHSSGCRAVVLLASGVCPLVGEIGLGACAGFLVGRPGAYSLVGGAGSCHSGDRGRAMSSGVFIGGFWLRTTLGGLSADGWNCVLTLLVVWPEASPHWSLQAVG